MPPMRAIVLSDKDVALLQRLLDIAGNANPNLRSSNDGMWMYGEDQSAPEVYVAKPTSGTIPPLTPAAGWTGTGTGTGTAPECDQWDSPGFAECRIYEIVETDSCGPALQEVEDHDKKVYNLTENTINPGNGYISIQRDKFGKWLAVTGGGTASGRYALLETDLDVGGSCRIREYTQDIDGYWCIPGSEYQAYDPLGELQGTAFITGCEFVEDAKRPVDVSSGLSWAAIKRVTCPNFNCQIGQCAGTGSGTGTGSAT